MSMITFKGIKSSYQRVKRMLSNPGDIPPTEAPVKKKPEILHLGLQNQMKATTEEPTGLDPFYDEINMSDNEGSAGDLYSTLDRYEKREEEESEYSYAVLDRSYDSSTKKKSLPPITPRPRIPSTSQYDLINRSNNPGTSEPDNEDENYSVLHRIPIPYNVETEEESYSYGHYDDITEFQGRMFLSQTDEPIKSWQQDGISPRNTDQIGKSSAVSQRMSAAEKRMSVHLELMAKMQDKIPTQPPKSPLRQTYSSNLELLVNQRRPSQQEETSAAIKNHFSIHEEWQENEDKEDVPIYEVANKFPQRKQLEKTYSSNLQLASLSLNLTKRPGLNSSEKRNSESNVPEDDWNLKECEGQYVVEDMYETPGEHSISQGYSQKSGGMAEENDEGEIYAIPYKTT